MHNISCMILVIWGIIKNKKGGIEMRKFLIGVLVGCLLMMTTPVLADSILQSIDVVFDSVQVQVDGEKVGYEHHII